MDTTEKRCACGVAIANRNRTGLCGACYHRDWAKTNKAREAAKRRYRETAKRAVPRDRTLIDYQVPTSLAIQAAAKVSPEMFAVMTVIDVCGASFADEIARQLQMPMAAVVQAVERLKAAGTVAVRADGRVCRRGHV